jgi:hypothetical protein
VIKLIIFLALALALAYCGATVKLGKRTFFGHVRAIWATEEAQDLKHGVEEGVGPAAHRIKKGIQAGVKAMEDDDAGVPASGSARGSGSAAPALP